MCHIINFQEIMHPCILYHVVPIPMSKLVQYINLQVICKVTHINIAMVYFAVSAFHLSILASLQRFRIILDSNIYALVIWGLVQQES